MVRMETDYSFLHKILKDSTRRDILRYLNDRPLSYMELMNLSKITNTGKLNYHLKVLGELIQKTADDKYSLTDRDVLPSNCLRSSLQSQFRENPFYLTDP